MCAVQQGHYLAERGHCHQGIPGLHDECILQPAISLSMYPAAQMTRKRDSSDETTFFHCSEVQFRFSCGHCRSFQWWTWVSMGQSAAKGFLFFICLWSQCIGLV
ncbi:hypothetical protein COCON_G00091050 [Conger conger]|uniref:Uncharacterized protein n=1 Tax=Conger conger TaxID=82655 RepID=A0A9Q1DKZ7_CONCO|nr:hypothetical protein COCON_G00091050 [Conger conger]